MTTNANLHVKVVSECIKLSGIMNRVEAESCLRTAMNGTEFEQVNSKIWQGVLPN